MAFSVVIPARFQSSRLPGKPLLDLGGLSMLQRVYQQACKSDASQVYIATDHADILYHAKEFCEQVIMTRQDHSTGTDRLQEVAQYLSLADDHIIVNVQGDEPFIDAVSLSKLIDVFKKDTKQEIDLASLKVQITKKEDIENPNNVKVITDINNLAIYFSRSVIPYYRDKDLAVKYYKHKGVYAFRKQALIDFYNTPMTPLEAAEKIEAIRYQEIGKKIKMVETAVEAIGIDTPEDLEKAKKYLNF